MPATWEHPGLTQGELEAWGESLGRQVATPLVLALSGPLGAGKSVLARAVAHGAGVTGPVPSPTYNLLFRYELPGGGVLVHLDLYRLSGPDELWELGWDEVGGPNELVVVEWPERAGEHLPAPRWDVALHLVEGRPDLRALRVREVGDAPPLPALPVGSFPGAALEARR